MIPLKSSTGEKKKKNQGSRASLVIHNNSRVSSPRLITLGASCNARGRRSVFELVRLSSQADENELAEEDTYSRLSVVRVRACVRAREEREKSSRTRPSGRKNLKRAQQPSSRDRSTRKKQRGRRTRVLEIARPDNFRNASTPRLRLRRGCRIVDSTRARSTTRGESCFAGARICVSRSTDPRV